jgi:hypothetical protein
MAAVSEIEAALRSCSTKREVAEKLGMTGNGLGARLFTLPRLRAIWRRLPADGAFAGRDNTTPKPCRSQDDADALVAEALADAPIDPTVAQRVNMVRLMLAMYSISGSMLFPRGWARAVILAFESARADVPTLKSIRWYRSHLSDAPSRFANVPGIDRQLIEDLNELPRK